MDFTWAESIVALGGRRLLSLSWPRSAIFVFDWVSDTETLASTGWRDGLSFRCRARWRGDAPCVGFQRLGDPTLARPIALDGPFTIAA